MNKGSPIAPLKWTIKYEKDDRPLLPELNTGKKSDAPQSASAIPADTGAIVRSIRNRAIARIIMLAVIAAGGLLGGSSWLGTNGGIVYDYAGRIVAGTNQFVASASSYIAKSASVPGPGTASALDGVLLIGKSVGKTVQDIVDANNVFDIKKWCGQ